MSDRVKVSALPDCDIHMINYKRTVPAYADCAVPRLSTWANVCRECFVKEKCRLGTGRGQVLELVEERPLTTCQGCGHVAAKPVDTPHACWRNEDGEYEEGGTYQ